MTLEANVLRDDAVRSTSGGYEVDLHLAWYRSLPLSCVENIRLNLAGELFESEQIKVVVNNQQLSLRDLASLEDEWWFVLDPLTVTVTTATPTNKGDKISVDVSLATRIPYIIIGPDMALVQRTDVAKEVTVQ